MLKLIKKLFPRTKTSNDHIKKEENKIVIQPSRKDELLGFWENGADDGSGLHAIWGYGIEFLENGKGFNHNWGVDDDSIERKQEINWKRISDKSISMKFIEENEWSTIEYEISDFIGAYNSKNIKLVERGTNQFWSSPEPLYKRK